MYALVFMLLLIIVFYVLKSKTSIRLVVVLTFAAFCTLFCVVPNQYRNTMISTISRKQNDFKNVARGGMHIKTDTNYIYISGSSRDALTIDGDSVLLTKEIEARTYDFGSDARFGFTHLVPTGKKWKFQENGDQANSYFETTSIHGSGWQLIKNIPAALLNAALRPFIGDKGGLMKYVSILETFAILIFIFLCFKYRKTLAPFEKKCWTAFIIASLFLYTIIGLTTPVSGAIVRYRIPIIYLLFPLLLLSIKFTEKQQKWIERWFA
jgi:hypothetical protein